MRITKKEKINALGKSIEHWKRMIRWARTRHPSERAGGGDMLTLLGETWGNLHCSLCQIFEKLQCHGCPIGDGGYCCKAYRDVSNSMTWGEWLPNAEKMVIFLKSKKAKLKKELSKKV